MKKRILFISNLYPNNISKNLATYNKQQISALRKYCDVTVMAPVSWIELFRNTQKFLDIEENCADVYHPKYYYTPRIFRGLYGYFYYYSIKHVAMKLLEEKPFELIFSSWLYPDSWAAAKLARRYKLPLYVKVHGTDVNRLRPGTLVTRRSLDVIRQAKKVICVSNALKERLLELGAPEDKLKVLYNGIDDTIFHLVDKDKVRRKLNIDHNVFLVLFVGNLKKEKGLRELAVAFKEVADDIDTKSQLIIIGSGPYRVSIEHIISKMGFSDAVHFLGSQSLESIAQWMNAASVLCLPSYMEGIPNVVLEALSCGTMVVATQVGGIPELDRKDGMLTLVPPRDETALAKALLMVSKSSGVKSKTATAISWKENGQKLYSLLSGET